MEHDRTPAATIPDFTPVPRKCDRSNGWKPEVQRAFIEALAETGSVKAACRRVGRADHGVYQLRRHPEAEEFRRAWQAALDLGIQRIENVAMDRAINGTEEPVYSYGKLVGTRIKYNDRLLMFMLRNRAPGRFTDGRAKALSASDKTQLARLKKEWREEWEREEFGGDQETCDSIDRFIDDMHTNRMANMGPRTRTAWEEYQRIEKEENADYGSWLQEGGQQAETNPAPPQLPPPDAENAGKAEEQPDPLGHARAHTLAMAEERAQQLPENEASPTPESANEPEPPPAPPRAEPRIYSLNDFPVRRY